MLKVLCHENLWLEAFRLCDDVVLIDPSAITEHMVIAGGFDESCE